MSVHTLRVQEERITPPFLEDMEDVFERRYETMWVRLPYLAAFGTIASLYNNCVSFHPRRNERRRVWARMPDVRWKGGGRRSPSSKYIALATTFEFRTW